MRIAVNDSRVAVVDRINKLEVKDLYFLDWEEITSGFKGGCLHEIVSMINDRYAQIAAVRSCLKCYKCHLIDTDYEFYQEHWDLNCPFQDYCLAMIWDLQDNDTFIGAEYDRSGALTENEMMRQILESGDARKLLGRLPLKYYRNSRWDKSVTKAFISQVAHVLSGLLEIPDCKKWTYFEQYWSVTGLAKAFSARNGRDLDQPVKDLFPEYEERFGARRADS